MDETQMLISKIKDFLDSSNKFYQDLLGYKPEQTSLQQIPETRWYKSAKLKGLNPNSLGIYLPRSQTAIIRGENPLSLFHEYFGHGLYCEQNLTGKKLVELEKKLLEEEKQELKTKKFTLRDLQNFRQQNPIFQELKDFWQRNLRRYELFAIWTEYLLSGEHGLRDSFEIKYDFLTREAREAIDSIIDFSKQYGNLATFYAQGMARRTTPERVKKLLGDIYKDKIKFITFALLYGSRKEFSDIDIYLISDEIKPFSSDWIDVRVHTQRRFEKGIINFDVRVTDPLFSGEFIFGNRDYFEQQKQVLKNQQITEEAISYNFQKSENYKKFVEKDFELCDQVENPLSYSQTYLANAIALREGKKLFTKKKLLLYLKKQAPVEGDKPPQMKGGKFK